MKKHRTTLSLIGKDEVQGLKDLVSDVGKYFDEITLVSTDHNKKLIETAKKLGIKVYDEYFGKTGKDFKTDEARNFSFDKIRNLSFGKSTGDVIAWFDLDDRIPNGYVIPFIIKAIQDGDTDWVYCNYNYAFDSEGDVLVRHTKPRFFRKGTVKWVKSVHEDAVAIKNVKQSKDSDFLTEPLIINHQNVFDAEKVRARSERNLGLLLTEYEKDGDKTDLRTIQNIGMTYSGMGEYENAIKFLLMHYKNTGATEDKYWSLLKTAFCLRELGKYNEAINTSLESLKLIPQWATAYFDIAETYSIMAKYQEVIEWTNVGLTKKFPETLNIIQPKDYDINPLSRLSEAYMMIGNYKKALSIAQKLQDEFPKNKLVKELVRNCENVVNIEEFVKSFLMVAQTVRKEDRLKAIQLFDSLPEKLDGDFRIQEMRFEITPPKTWEDKSIVIFCGQGIPETHWAYPSIFTGIGGSERMVIQMSQELTKLGYKVTVYNNCGELRGEYDGVTYLPFYHFNPKDNYNILIGWRCPQLFQNDIRANKKLIWLHDIAYRWQFNDESIEKTDKFIFLSKWHRDNMPEINESKVYVSNNGIVPEDYQTPISIKKEELVLTCSYDRGVLTLIRDIMPLVHKKLGRKIKTHICYGWNNIDKELDILPELKVLKHDLEPLFEQDWVIHHGRIGSKEVAELLRTSIIYPYSTEFSETNNMSSQAAQANGCYVLTTTNSGGTPEYLKFGEAMPLNNIYTDKEEQEKYADRLVELIKNPPKIDEESRKKIIDQFSIKETANKWKEGLL